MNFSILFVATILSLNFSAFFSYAQGIQIGSAKDEKIYFSAKQAAVASAEIKTGKIKIVRIHGSKTISCDDVYAGFKASCSYAVAKYLVGVVKSKENEILQMIPIQCTNVRYTGPLAKHFPNGRDYCQVISQLSVSPYKQ